MRAARGARVCAAAARSGAAILRTRGLPELGLDSYMAGGTPAQWFDVLVHRQEVAPALPA